MNSSRRNKSMWPMRDIDYPHENDIVCGRGGMANNHPGNIAFRELVNQFKVQYIKSSRHQKTQLAEDLVQQWQSTHPPGRFVKRNDVTGMYDDVGKKKARSKTSQLLREDAPTIRKQENIPDTWDDEDLDYHFGQPTENQRVMNDAIPPPPPQDPNETPPLQLQRRKSSKDLKVPSPNSVVTMMEDVMMESNGIHHQQTNTSSYNHNRLPEEFNDSIDDNLSTMDLKLPALPVRKKPSATTNNTNKARLQNNSRKQHFQELASPLDAFLKNMLQERAAVNQGIAILQDNATRPSHSKSSHHGTAGRGPSFFPTDASVPDDDFSAISWSRGSLHGNSSHNGNGGGAPPAMPDPNRFASSRRVNTLEVVAMEILVRPRNFSESEHSSFRGIGLDEDDPLLQLPINSVHKERRSSTDGDAMSLDSSHFGSSKHRSAAVSTNSTSTGSAFKDLLVELEAMSVASLTTSSSSSKHHRAYMMDAVSTHSGDSLLQTLEFAEGTDFDESTNAGGVGDASLRDIFQGFA